jgi:precorrin-6A/cobalt-precorrin-6A reductase
MRRVLILGGTAEGRALAQDLSDLPVISSLAGRVASPRLPVGEVRVGGFGGPQALARWLDEQGVAAVVDATHPFAERISASAEQASATSGVPLLRLERPGWQAKAGDDWHWVDDLPGAAAALDALGARQVFLTTGRHGLSAFAGDDSRSYLIRCVDPPEVALPANHEVLLDRGPYTLDGELRLLDDHAIDVVVTKDSGGELTVAKLEAARARQRPVIVVRRPPRGAVATVRTVEEAAAWARAQASG